MLKMKNPFTSNAENMPYILNLGNTIIGVTVLASPYCFDQCGIILGTLLLVFTVWLTRISCNLLVRSASNTKQFSYEFLAFHTFGSTGKLVVEISMICLVFGALVAIHVVIGDIGPEIVAELTGLEETSHLRIIVMVIMGLGVALPLALLRNMSSLNGVSVISLIFYGIFIANLLCWSVPILLSGEWLNSVHFWRTSGIFQCFPIFALSFSCQTQIFVTWEVVRDPSPKKLDNIVQGALTISSFVYMMVGLFGYIAFSSLSIQGDILINMPQTFFTNLIKLGFVISVAISFPLVIFPCRDSLFTLLFPSTNGSGDGVSGTRIPEETFRGLTVVLTTCSLAIGILVPDIEFILGFTGATTGALICFVLPALIFLTANINAAEKKTAAQVVLFVGLVIFVVSTYATIYAEEIKVERGIERGPMNRQLSKMTMLDKSIFNISEEHVEKFPTLPSFDLPKQVDVEIDKSGKEALNMSQRIFKRDENPALLEKLKVRQGEGVQRNLEANSAQQRQQQQRLKRDAMENGADVTSILTVLRKISSEISSGKTVDGKAA